MNHNEYEVSWKYHTLLDWCRDDSGHRKSPQERNFGHSIIPLLRTCKPENRLAILKDAFIDYCSDFQDELAVLVIPFCTRALQDELVVPALLAQTFESGMLDSKDFRVKTAELAKELYGRIVWSEHQMMLGTRATLVQEIAKRCKSTQDREEGKRLFEFLADLRLPAHCPKFTEIMCDAVKSATDIADPEICAERLEHIRTAPDYHLSHASALRPIVRAALVRSFGEEPADRLLAYFGKNCSKREPGAPVALRLLQILEAAEKK